MIVKHLAEFSHELTTRPGRPHIPSERPRQIVGGKALLESVLSGEGHGSGKRGLRLQVGKCCCFILPGS